MTLFIRVLECPPDERANTLARRGSAPRFEVDPNDLQLVPTSPFAYWIGSAVREVFSTCPALAHGDRVTRQGLATSDDFRFIRSWYEVSSKWVRASNWIPIAKGGSFSRFYRDLHALVAWVNRGIEMKAFAESRPGVDHWSKRITNTDSYGTPGVTWPLRGVDFSAQAVPSGCAFSIAGKMAFTPRPQLLTWLAVMNSAPFDSLMKLFAGKVGGVQYESGLLQRTPVPSMESSEFDRLSMLTRAGWSARRGLDTASEVSHAFVVPGGVAGGRRQVRCSAGRMGRSGGRR